MAINNLADLLRKIKVETGSLVCFDCGYEHNCGIHGCAIIQAAADRLGNQNTHILALQREIEGLRSQNEQLREASALLAKESAELLERRWIPVEERLPEVWRNDETAELVNYMIYSPDFGVDIGNYHAKAKKWLCMALPCTVTHWMPLPSGPEVKNAETK